MSILLQLQEKLGGVISGNSLIGKCPSCGKDNHFVVYNNPHGIYTTCYKCGYWIRDFKGILKQGFRFNESKAKFVSKKVLTISSLPDVYTLDDPEFGPALSYLKSRNIDEGTIRRYELGLGKVFPWKDRIVFYVLGEMGIPVFVGGRTINKNEKLRYYYPAGSPKSDVLFNLEHVPETEKTVILVEGAFDVLSSRLHNAVALFGKSLNNKQKGIILRRFKKVIVWLDNPEKDSTTIDASHKICHDLFHDIDTYMLIQVHGSDPGDCPDPQYELNNHIISYTLEEWLKYKVSKL